MQTPATITALSAANLAPSAVAAITAELGYGESISEIVRDDEFGKGAVCVYITTAGLRGRRLIAVGPRGRLDRIYGY